MEKPPHHSPGKNSWIHTCNFMSLKKPLIAKMQTYVISILVLIPGADPGFFFPGGDPPNQKKKKNPPDFYLDYSEEKNPTPSLSGEILF
jgi:hypothetical protein